jgi:hypothetical protein
MRGKTLLAVAASVTALIGGMATSANAEGNGTTVGRYDYLRPHGYTYDFATGDSYRTRSIDPVWIRGSDSPIDTNHRALRVTIPDATATHSYYATAHTRRSLDIDAPVGDVQNLSFDVDQFEHIGAGSPRISVVFNNGDVAYLSANYCVHDMIANNRWGRSDFTGFVHNCGFYVTTTDGGSPTQEFYEANGYQTAWDVYAEQHPNKYVASAYLVMDEPGRYGVDRIALGTDRLYNYDNVHAKQCLGSEGRC